MAEEGVRGGVGVNKPRVLVTGAGGFIGRRMVATLLARGYEVRAATSGPSSALPERVEVVRPRFSSGEIDWDKAAVGVDAVIHLAGRTHIMRETSSNPLEEFRRVNVRATARLARDARAGGARRFIYLSSIKMNGSETSAPAFTEMCLPAPSEPYAVSKWEAEQALRDLCAGSMELVIVRPPLVYGPGVKGNFARLLQLVASGVPLPLGSVNNLRSYIGLGNLCDFVATCLRHEGAVNELFVVSDGEDISTPALIAHIAHAMNRPVRLFPFPIAMLRAAASLTGMMPQYERLIGSLRVDASYARRRLAWCPPVTLREGIVETVVDYVRRCGRVA